MKVNKNDISATLEIDREELAQLLAKGVMKIGGKRNFTLNSNLPPQIFVNLSFSRNLTKREVTERKEMMERAEKILINDFIDDFQNHTVGNKNSVSRISITVKGFVGREESLAKLISEPASELVKFRGISQGMVDILETYVKSRGFRFAIQNGNELV